MFYQNQIGTLCGKLLKRSHAIFFMAVLPRMFIPPIFEERDKKENLDIIFLLSIFLSLTYVLKKDIPVLQYIAAKINPERLKFYSIFKLFPRNQPPNSQRLRAKSQKHNFKKLYTRTCLICECMRAHKLGNCAPNYCIHFLLFALCLYK